MEPEGILQAILGLWDDWPQWFGPAWPEVSARLAGMWPQMRGATSRDEQAAVISELFLLFRQYPEARDHLQAALRTVGQEKRRLRAGEEERRMHTGEDEEETWGNLVQALGQHLQPSTEFDHLEPSNWLALLPEEPPRFTEAALYNRPFIRHWTRIVSRRNIRYALRGLDWIIRKNRIPPNELIPIQLNAYPQASLELLESLRQDEQEFLEGVERSMGRSLRERRDRESIYESVYSLREQLRERPELIRITDWTAALMVALDFSRLPPILRAFRTVESFGVGRDETDGNRMVFGVFIYIEDLEEASYSSSRDSPRLRYLADLLSLPLRVGGYEFPIVLRRGLFINDSGSVDIHPLNGTAACWAVSSACDIGSDRGFLTAAHLLSEPEVGKEIATRSGPGQVLAIAPGAGYPYGIDAMLVRPTCGMPHLDGHQQITLLQLVAPFTPARFIGMSSGLVKTTITEVTNLFGTLSLYIPARVFLADGGKGGDSGALIQTGSGAGAGLYTGRFRDKAGRENGIGMHLAQVADAMKLELYDL